LADSLYNKLVQGADFGKLATAFSNDVVSAAANGLMPVFGVGDYDAFFEKAAFALPKDGAISKPILTAHGYHIVKRLQRLPVITDKKDEKAVQALREKVESSDRMALTQAAMVQRIVQQAGLKRQPFSEAALWAYSDSLLDGKPNAQAQDITGTTVMFSIGDQQVTAAEWITHAQTFRYRSDGTGFKAYPQLWEEFVQAAALAYYKGHLEQYNEAFRQQLEEFREGNLFFEIMQREVWNKAQEDTVGLATFYKAHASNYVWNRSADAVIFYANDMTTAKRLKAQLSKTPQQWRMLAASLSENVAADSARFELSQIPGGQKQPVKKGLITEPERNETDNTASFAYILNVYNTPAPRSFTEAKGLVVSDYQAALEKAWIEELKKKYPVTINEAALSGL
jgi:peptidyl-prolyl cis-trans isomerase SurA